MTRRRAQSKVGYPTSREEKWAGLELGMLETITFARRLTRALALPFVRVSPSFRRTSTRLGTFKARGGRARVPTIRLYFRGTRLRYPVSTLLHEMAHYLHWHADLASFLAEPHGEAFHLAEAYAEHHAAALLFTGLPGEYPLTGTHLRVALANRAALAQQKGAQS